MQKNVERIVHKSGSFSNNNSEIPFIDVKYYLKWMLLHSTYLQKANALCMLGEVSLSPLIPDAPLFYDFLSLKITKLLFSFMQTESTIVEILFY